MFDKSKKPGLTVVLGIGKPGAAKPPMPSAPWAAGPKGLASKSAPPSPKGGPPGPDADEDLEKSGTKASAEDASVFDPSKNCGACSNYSQADGTCRVVEGNFTPDQGCVKYFESSPDDDDLAVSGAPGEQPDEEQVAA